MLHALRAWGDKLAARDTAPAVEHHGHPVRTRVTCATCGERVRGDDLQYISTGLTLHPGSAAAPPSAGRPGRRQLQSVYSNYGAHRTDETSEKEKDMTMKAALYRRAGPAAEVLQVEEIERPLPGPGEVLVRERAMTAHYCLFSDGPVSGQSVLVAGGAGAVGHFAIELAKRAGARVIATVSSAEKAALAERAGIDCLA